MGQLVRIEHAARAPRAPVVAALFRALGDEVVRLEGSGASDLVMLLEACRSARAITISFDRGVLSPEALDQLRAVGSSSTS